jgi:hypothetical protein
MDKEADPNGALLALAGLLESLNQGRGRLDLTGRVGSRFTRSLDFTMILEV